MIKNREIRKNITRNQDDYSCHRRRRLSSFDVANKYKSKFRLLYIRSMREMTSNAVLKTVVLCIGKRPLTADSKVVRPLNGMLTMTRFKIENKIAINAVDMWMCCRKNRRTIRGRRGDGEKREFFQ